MAEATLAELLTNVRIKHNIFEVQENYDRIDVDYKVVNGTGIETAILVPRALSDKKMTVPIIVHFHGGGLIIGTNWEPAWLSDWSASPTLFLLGRLKITLTELIQA